MPNVLAVVKVVVALPVLSVIPVVLENVPPAPAVLTKVTVRPDVAFALLFASLSWAVRVTVAPGNGVAVFGVTR